LRTAFSQIKLRAYQPTRKVAEEAAKKNNGRKWEEEERLVGLDDDGMELEEEKGEDCFVVLFYE